MTASCLWLWVLGPFRPHSDRTRPRSQGNSREEGQRCGWAGGVGRRKQKSLQVFGNKSQSPQQSAFLSRLSKKSVSSGLGRIIKNCHSDLLVLISHHLGNDRESTVTAWGCLHGSPGLCDGHSGTLHLGFLLACRCRLSQALDLMHKAAHGKMASKCEAAEADAPSFVLCFL